MFAGVLYDSFTLSIMQPPTFRIKSLMLCIFRVASTFMANSQNLTNTRRWFLQRQEDEWMRAWAPQNAPRVESSQLIWEGSNATGIAKLFRIESESEVQSWLSVLASEVCRWPTVFTKKVVYIYPPIQVMSYCISIWKGFRDVRGVSKTPSVNM